MTLAELKATLEAMDRSQFAAFKKAFGGDYDLPQGYVDGFLHHPEWERSLCQLLSLPTQEERLTMASLASAQAAVESAKSARLSMLWSAMAVVVAVSALILASR